MPKHSLCVFDGDSVDQLRATLNDPEYSGPGTKLRFSRDGNEFYMTVISASGEDPGDINASHPCPGSPGC